MLTINIYVCVFHSQISKLRMYKVSRTTKAIAIQRRSSTNPSGWIARYERVNTKKISLAGNQNRLDHITMAPGI